MNKRSLEGPAKEGCVKSKVTQYQLTMELPAPLWGLTLYRRMLKHDKKILGKIFVSKQFNTYMKEDIKIRVAQNETSGYWYLQELNSQQHIFKLWDLNIIQKIFYSYWEEVGEQC